MADDKTPLEQAADAINAQDAPVAPAPGGTKLSKVSGKKIVQPDDAMKVRNATGSGMPGGVRGEISLDLILIAATIIAIVLGVGWWHHSIVQGVVDKYEAAAAKAAAERQTAIGKLEAELAATKSNLADDRAKSAFAQQAQQTEFNRRLHDFVPQKALGQHCLSAGFVRYTDSAATGMPLPAGPQPGLASADGGVGDDEAAGVIARNYERARVRKQRWEDTLKEFDAIRAQYNAKVAEINKAARR